MKNVMVAMLDSHVVGFRCSKCQAVLSFEAPAEVGFVVVHTPEPGKPDCENVSKKYQVTVKEV